MKSIKNVSSVSQSHGRVDSNNRKVAAHPIKQTKPSPQSIPSKKPPSSSHPKQFPKPPSQIEPIRSEKQTIQKPPKPPKTHASTIDYTVLDSDGDDEILEEDSENYFCIYCLDRPRTHIVVPCCHLIACGDCIRVMSSGAKCPVCESLVLSTDRCI